MSVNVPSGYKQTKVGIIPDDWDVVKLGDVSSRVTKKNTDNEINLVFTNSAVNGIVIQNEFFDKDIANRDNLTGYYIVESDDFVYNPRISKHAPSGPINRNRHELSGIVSPLYTVFRTKDNEIIDYLEYFFSSTLWFRYMQSISNYGARHDRMNITNSDFMQMPILYPSKEEQQKISKILTTVDETISKQEALIKAKEEFKKGLMQKLLSGDIRFNGFEGEWKEMRLGDIASRITTKNTDNSIDMVFTNSAVNGIVIQNEFFDKDIANRDNLTGYYIVKSGDFVYNPRISKHAPSGPINRNRHEFSGIVSPLYTVFRTNDNEIIDYLEYFFSSILWFRYMKAIANYGARHDRMNITNSDFMKMPIPYPSKEEQQKIAQILTLVDKEIDLLKNELEALKEQKRGLMQKLLSGEVRVKV